MARSLAIPLLAGSAIGVAVAFGGLKVFVLLAALVGGWFLFTTPTAPFWAIVATVPVNVQIGGFITVTRVVILGSLAALVFQVLTKRAAWPAFWNGAPAYTGFAFFSAVVTATLLVGADGALEGLGQYFIYAIIFFASLVFVKEPEDLKRVLMIIVGMAMFEVLLVALDILYQYRPLGGRHEWLTVSTELAENDERAFGTHAHPITLGVYFQLAVPAAIVLAYFSHSKMQRLLFVGMACSMLIGWWFTYSRTSMIGMVALLGIGLLAVSRISRVFVVVGGVLMFGVLASYGFSVVDLVLDLEDVPFLRDVAEKAGTAALGDSMMWRLENLQAAWAMIESNPLFGVGIEAVPGKMLDFMPVGTIMHWILPPSTPHNLFLHVWAETGIVAFVFFVLLWVLTFRSVVLAWRYAELRPYAKLFLVVILSQLTVVSFLPVVRESWLVLGLTCALGQMASRRRWADYEAMHPIEPHLLAYHQRP